MTRSISSHGLGLACIAAGFLGLAAMPLPAAADYLVVNAVDANTRQGEVVGAGTVLDIADGGILVLLAEDGTTLMIEGPYRGAPPVSGATGEEMVGRLAALWNRPPDASDLPSLRAGLVYEPDDPWVLDSGRQGDHCFRTEAGLRMWRRNGERRDRVSIRDASGTRERITWPRGETTLAWPSAFPVADGAVYKLRLGSAAETRVITFRSLSEGLVGDARTVLWLDEHGCEAQARRLLVGVKKAAFLLNFAKFVEWPTDMFADPSSPLTFCIIGKDPFGSIIDDLMHDKTIKGRAVALRRAVELGDHDGCHIVFLSALEDTDVEEVSRALAGADILIVGDRNLFAHEGGMINLVRKEKGVGMEINQSAVSRTRLRMSSKLLALADIVE